MEVNLTSKKEKLAEARVVLCCSLTYKEQKNVGVGKDQRIPVENSIKFSPTKNTLACIQLLGAVTAGLKVENHW